MLINAFDTFVFMNKCAIILSPEEGRRHELTDVVRYFLNDNFEKAKLPSGMANDVGIRAGDRTITVELIAYSDFSSLGANIGHNGEILIIIDKSLSLQDPKTLPRLKDPNTRTIVDLKYEGYKMSLEAYQQEDIPYILEDFNANHGVWDPKKLRERIGLVKDKIQKRLEDSV
jgi:hypothetical protein